MNLGDRIELDGEAYQVVSIVKDDGEGAYDVVDGRIPLPGEPGLAAECDDGTVVWLQTVAEIESRERIAGLEMEMDALLSPLREKLIEFEAGGDKVPVSVVASMLRAACSIGYVFAQIERPPGALALRSGFNPDGSVVE